MNDISDETLAKKYAQRIFVATKKYNLDTEEEKKLFMADVVVNLTYHFYALMIRMGKETSKSD